MKNVKRILTLVLAMMMILALAAPVMAAPGDFTITITNADPASSADHKYDAYQVLAGKLDSTGHILSDITWGASVTDGDALLAALQAEDGLKVGGVNIFAAATNADDVAEVLAKPAHQTTDILNAFAKVVYAQVGTNTPVASSTQADAPYTITIPADKPGYYLVKDDPAVLADKENKDVSDYILQVVGNVTVEHKGSIPTMDKQVSETGESYHDSILTGINVPHHYRIVAELPDDYNLYDEYYLEFSDKFSKELTFDSLDSVYVVIRSTGDRIEVDPSCYTLTTASIADDAAVMPGGTHMRVVLNNTKNIVKAGTTEKITLTPEDAVVIKYTAHVNDKAIVTDDGIPNQATIIYSNDPNSDGKGESTPDETHVYPINLKLLKVDGKDSTPLKDAKFVLSRLYNEGGSTHTEYVKLDANKKIDEWVHHYDGDGCASDNAEHLTAVTNGELGTILITDASGNIDVYGLDAGTYTLVEITPPDGYNKLVQGIEITVNATINEETDVIASMTGTTTQGNIEFDTTSATVKLTVPNFKGDVLPSTGGIGTTLFYVLGGMMVVCAAVLLITKKRMAAN